MYMHARLRHYAHNTPRPSTVPLPSPPPYTTDHSPPGGSPFDDLARKHSSCSSSKKGGELGWLSRGTFFPQFEEAAFATAVGGTCRATTGRGLHLIKVLAERYEKPKNLRRSALVTGICLIKCILCLGGELLGDKLWLVEERVLRMRVGMLPVRGSRRV